MPGRNLEAVIAATREVGDMAMARWRGEGRPVDVWHKSHDNPVSDVDLAVDRELLTSSAFRNGLEAAGRDYLVSTGRFALRGIGGAQDLYTLDPDILTDEAAAGKYARYVAG